MFGNKIILFILFLIFIFCFIIYINRIEESFNVSSIQNTYKESFNVNPPRDTFDQWQIAPNNSNYDKKWKEIENGYNNTVVPDTPSMIQQESQDTIVDLVKKDVIENVLNLFKQNKQEQGKKVDIPYVDLIQYNKQTWKKRIYEYKNEYDDMSFSILPGHWKKLPAILEQFINNFNYEYFRDSSEQAVPNYFGKKRFFILKYRLLKLMKNRDGSHGHDGSHRYDIVIVIFKENMNSGVHIYLELYSDATIKDFNIIGYEPSDKLFIFKGKSTLENNWYSTLFFKPNANQEDIPIFTDDEFRLYYDDHHYDLDRSMKHNYSCFNANPEFFKLTRGTEQNIIIPTYNKYECESDYDNVGRRRARGFWDRPCSTNAECPFYQSNQNYKNNRGGCTKEGYCEIPLGMQYFGYRKSIDYKKYPEYRPLCYNCKSKDKWKILTKLGHCCEEQKDRSQYPALQTPDYAFDIDIHDRSQGNI